MFLRRCAKSKSKLHTLSSHHIRSISSLSPLNETWNNNLETFKDNAAITQDDYTLTYGELDQRINSLCYMLRDQYKLKKGDSIAHTSMLRPEDVVVMMACTKLGCTYAPISPVYSTRIGDITESINAKAIIIEPQFLKYLNNDNIPQIILTEDFDPNQWIANEFMNTSYHDNSDEMVSNDDINNVFFTSGTTGLPKACLYSHQSFYNNTKEAYDRFKLQAELENYTTLIPALITPAACWQRWAILLNGKSMVYTNKYKHTDVSHWHYLCETKHPEITDILAFGRALSDIYHFDKPFSNLKYMIISGDFIPFKTVANVKKKLLPTDIKLVNGYGQTETGWIAQLDPVAMAQCVDEYMDSEEMGQSESINVSVGTPLKNTYISFDDNGHVLVKKDGDSMMREYLNNPEKTAETITNDGWIKTGDIGFIDKNGCLTLQGREKDIIIPSSGYPNISPVEIETVLLNHKDVNEVAVIGYPNRLRDDTLSGETPVAFVSLTDKSVVNKEKIKQELMELSGNLLSVDSRVDDIYFVDELPKTAARKLDKNAMKAMLYDKV